MKVDMVYELEGFWDSISKSLKYTNIKSFTSLNIRNLLSLRVIVLVIIAPSQQLHPRPRHEPLPTTQRINTNYPRISYLNI